ncbi:MerR family transcriptional regulator [Agrobacterium rubi]|nr:MerR family transcriptional regulator [Agrobacterium rubi]NTF23862.1 MerR family transcriptional regulator [Agrobacterium rubi]
MNREELEAATGVSARNIRYLITEGILPAPEGPARAARYSHEHLRILGIYTEAKAEGVSSLDVIRRRIAGEGARSTVQIVPGIELTVEPGSIPAGTTVEDIMAALRAAVETKIDL